MVTTLSATSLSDPFAPCVSDASAMQRLIQASTSSASGATPARARVILVTDQWLALSDQPGNGFARLLEREALACLVVGADGAELDRSAAYEPDIVLVRMAVAIDQRIAALYRIRERFSCPVVMLGGGDGGGAQLTDELIALEAGFDDVWQETGTDRLLIARIRAQLRRGARTAAPSARAAGRVVLGGLVIDREGAVVRYAGRSIAMTPAQLDALNLLARHQGRVVSREQIQAHCIGLRPHGATDADGPRQHRAVDALVSRLRTRLAAAQVTSIEIRSVQGRGYRLGVRQLAPGSAGNQRTVGAPSIGIGGKTQAQRPQRERPVLAELD